MYMKGQDSLLFLTLFKNATICFLHCYISGQKVKDSLAKHPSFDPQVCQQ